VTLFWPLGPVFQEDRLSELKRGALCFLYFFLLMSGYYILKPVRESLFLQLQGFQKLPWAHMGVAVLTLGVVQVYAALARNLSRRALVVVANVFFLTSILGFWYALTQISLRPEALKALAWGYFFWVSLFVVFAVTLFWSLCHSLFTPEAGRRIYGWVGSGGILGALVGGKITSLLAQQLRTENLLLVSAVLLTPCLLIGWILGGLPVLGKKDPEKDSDAPAARRGPWEIFHSNPYLLCLAGILFLSLFISILDDYRYQQVIQEAFSSKDARTAYFGSLYTATNTIGLFLSLVVMRPVLLRWGPLPGLLLYPLAVVGGSLAFLVWPPEQVIFWAAVAIQSVSYSIYQFSREVLYLPCSQEEKFVAKGFNGTFVFRLGGGVGSVFVLLAWPANGVSQISYVTIPVALVIVALIFWITRRFSELQELPDGT
jgi:AAA family ATP:ADP antiporter